MPTGNNRHSPPDGKRKLLQGIDSIIRKVSKASDSEFKYPQGRKILLEYLKIVRRKFARTKPFPKGPLLPLGKFGKTAKERKLLKELTQWGKSSP